MFQLTDFVFRLFYGIKYWIKHQRADMLIFLQCLWILAYIKYGLCV